MKIAPFRTWPREYRELVVFNFFIAVCITTLTILTHTPFWGHEYSTALGTVTNITPHDHMMVSSEYSVAGIKYKYAGSGDCDNLCISAPITVFYRIDNPGIATYDESLYSVVSGINFILLGIAYFTIFIWVIGLKIIRKIRGIDAPSGNVINISNWIYFTFFGIMMLGTILLLSLIIVVSFAILTGKRL